MQARSTALTALLLLLLALGAVAVAPAAKQPVRTLGDLPRHVYPLDVAVSALLRDDAAFARFCARVRADIEADLDAYDIADRAAVQRLQNTLLSIDMAEGKDEAALARIEAIRALEDKEASRLTAGLTARAYIAARRATGAGPVDAAFRAGFRREMEAQLAPLPPAIVRDNIQSQKGRLEILSEPLLMGMVQSQLDPVVAKAGEASSDLAAQIVNMGAAMRTALPLRDELLGAYTAWLAAGQEEAADIWAARDVSLEGRAGLAPVLIAVWDSGVDTAVFPGRLFVNPGERPDGRDDDGNGFVDDVHGIAWDYDGEAVPALLHPLGDQEGRLADAMQAMKGFTNLQAGVESPDAARLRQHMAGMDAAAVGPFMDSLSFAGLHAHGTHVAGIALAGNPAARVLVARISFDYHTIPKPLTRESARRHADSYRRTVDYFRAHGVRAVNMSWGWSLKEIESALEANDVGASAEERGRLAAELLGVLRDGMREAIASAPGILFVAAAGNDDNDVEFDQSIPGSLDLPNLMMVGAVDQAGRRTGFTSSGRRVRVYANGFEVESTVPGGARMRMSGTSMASPNALNLAAKLLALRSDLGPTRLVSLIERGADSLEGQPELRLLNPRQTLALLERE